MGKIELNIMTDKAFREYIYVPNTNILTKFVAAVIAGKELEIFKDEYMPLETSRAEELYAVVEMIEMFNLSVSLEPLRNKSCFWKTFVDIYPDLQEMYTIKNYTSMKKHLTDLIEESCMAA